MTRALVLLCCFWACQARADLYRWIDPETGSIKFSSYPPPWYGDPAQERRAPKVERIPQGRPGAAVEAPAPAEAAAAGPDAGAPVSLEQRRKAVLGLLLDKLTNPTAAGPDEAMRALLAIAEPVREYRSIAAALAQSDPAGEPARRKEWEAFVTGLEARRRSMAAELLATQPPGPGTPPAEVQRAIRQLQAKLVAFGGIAGTLRVIDPAGDAVRMAELQALEQRLTAAWKTQIDLFRQPVPQR